MTSVTNPAYLTKKRLGMLSELGSEPSNKIHKPLGKLAGRLMLAVGYLRKTESGRRMAEHGWRVRMAEPRNFGTSELTWNLPSTSGQGSHRLSQSQLPSADWGVQSGGPSRISKGDCIAPNSKYQVISPSVSCNHHGLRITSQASPRGSGARVPCPRGWS